MDSSVCKKNVLNRLSRTVRSTSIVAYNIYQAPYYICMYMHKLRRRARTFKDLLHAIAKPDQNFKRPDSHSVGKGASARSSLQHH